jgi:CRP-like cAMP-binding protein
MNETSVLSVPRKEFLSFVKKYPALTMRIIPILGGVINSTYERLADFVGDTVHQRVLNVLYLLYSKFGTILPVTREEIADMAGTTTETAIRALSRLRDLGIIDSRRGRIGILDEAKLRDVSRRSYLIFGADPEE